MLEYKRECLYTLIYDYILLCECIQILIITIIIMEVQRDICEKYKSYTVKEESYQRRNQSIYNSRGT